jgi:hypothetical protein
MTNIFLAKYQKIPNADIGDSMKIQKEISSILCVYHPEYSEFLDEMKQ